MSRVLVTVAPSRFTPAARGGCPSTYTSRPCDGDQGSRGSGGVVVAAAGGGAGRATSRRPLPRPLMEVGGRKVGLVQSRRDVMPPLPHLLLTQAIGVVVGIF